MINRFKNFELVIFNRFFKGKLQIQNWHVMDVLVNTVHLVKYLLIYVSLSSNDIIHLESTGKYQSQIWEIKCVYKDLSAGCGSRGRADL